MKKEDERNNMESRQKRWQGSSKDKRHEAPKSINFHFPNTRAGSSVKTDFFSYLLLRIRD
jgi:hypothetical protein